MWVIETDIIFHSDIFWPANHQIDVYWNCLPNRPPVLLSNNFCGSIAMSCHLQFCHWERTWRTVITWLHSHKRLLVIDHNVKCICCHTSQSCFLWLGQLTRHITVNIKLDDFLVNTKIITIFVLIPCFKYGDYYGGIWTSTPVQLSCLLAHMHTVVWGLYLNLKLGVWYSRWVQTSHNLSI